MLFYTTNRRFRPNGQASGRLTTEMGCLGSRAIDDDKLVQVGSKQPLGFLADHAASMAVAQHATI